MEVAAPCSTEEDQHAMSTSDISNSHASVDSLTQGSLDPLSDGSFTVNDAAHTANLQVLASADALTKSRVYSFDEDVPPVTDDTPPMPVRIGFSQTSLKGEDKHDIRDVEHNGRAYKMVAVFDGHGGKDASEYCTEHLLQYVEEAVPKTAGGGETLDDMGEACT